MGMSNAVRSMARESREFAERTDTVGSPVTSDLNDFLGSWERELLACEPDDATEARYHLNSLKWCVRSKAHRLLLGGKPVNVFLYAVNRPSARIEVNTLGGNEKKERLSDRSRFPLFTGVPITRPNAPIVLPPFTTEQNSPEATTELNQWLASCQNKLFPVDGDCVPTDAKNDIKFVNQIAAHFGKGLYLDGKRISLHVCNPTGNKNVELITYRLGNNGQGHFRPEFPLLEARSIPPPGGSKFEEDFSEE